MIVLMTMTMLMLAIAERAADGQVGSGIGRPITSHQVHQSSFSPAWGRSGVVGA